MSNIRQASDPSTQSEFPRKLALLFLLSISTVIFIYFFFRLRPEIYPLVQNIFADLMLGVVIGFAVRIILAKRNWFIRILAGTAVLIVSLLILGVLTGWQIGLSPLRFWRTTIDWFGLVQLCLGISCMLLAILAWQKKEITEPVIIPTVENLATIPADPGTQPTRNPRKRRFRTPHAEAIIHGNTPKAEVSDSATMNNQLHPQSVTHQTKKQPIIRLSSLEKHLCPYCLDPVLPKDPRGIVACEICHTQHHGDCWAITGFCQVPHYTA